MANSVTLIRLLLSSSLIGEYTVCSGTFVSISGIHVSFTEHVIIFLQMFLKNDPMSLMQQGKDCHLYPTIPSVIYFLLHIQQLEIGGFKLANQMYKWGKMRYTLFTELTVCPAVSSFHLFVKHNYSS